MPTGVCVVGRVDLTDPENPMVLRPSVGDRVTGLRIAGYEANGIFAFGTDLRADHNRLDANGDYGAFSNTSTRTRFDHNTVKGNRGEAGLYVGDSQSAHAVVTRNDVTGNHGAGIFLRDVSRGVASRNTVSGNCSGIFLLADAPGPAGHWSIERNTVLSNNNECKATKEDDEQTPPLSGLGIVLAGADHTSVTRNEVHGQRHKHRSVAYGGIVVIKGDKAKPAHDLISRNVATLNSPDLNWDRTGSVSFSRNTCRQSKPASVCP
jgi:parallel beta-helix repeat protein